MRNSIFLLLVCPALWADPITPTINETLVETGNFSFTSVSATYNSTGLDFNATISGDANTFPGPPYGGGQAVADATLEAEFLVSGTGVGYLHYNTGGSADGSIGAFAASYMLNDIAENCLFSCTASGLDAFQLGTPFMLSETGIASAYSGPYFSDAGYQVFVNFTVSDAYGNPLPFTEVALPTPEPGSSGLILVGLGGLVSVLSCRKLMEREATRDVLRRA